MFIQIVVGIFILCVAYTYHCRRENAAYLRKEGEETNKDKAQEYANAFNDFNKKAQEYADVFNDFNKEDTDIRVVAVVRLAEVAQERFYQKDEHFLQEKYVSSSEEYPFFNDIAQQFIQAINIEKNLEVLSTIKWALIRMTHFANTKGRLNLLLPMTGMFADANHIAFHNFMESLADYLLTKSEAEKPQAIKLIGELTPFCDHNKRLNQEILETICATEEFQKKIKIRETFQQSWSEQEKVNHTEEVLLSEISDKANRLIMTRDVLVLSLQRGRSSSKRCFNELFLAGGDFSGHRLENGSFDKAILIGAKFVAADMKLTNFEQAILTGADMTGADLSLATLTGSDLRCVNFRGVDLSYTDLTSAMVAESNLDCAKITNGTWKKAVFEQNNVRDKNLYQRMFDKFNGMPTSVEEEINLRGKHPMFKNMIID